MGQYFIIYNLTKKQVVKPAFANWKLGEWEWEDVIKKMGWDSTDELQACGDSGSTILYKDGWTKEEEDEEFFNSEEEDSKNTEEDGGLWGSPPPETFKWKYICNVTGKILDQPYSFEEYNKLCKW